MKCGVWRGGAQSNRKAQPLLRLCQKLGGLWPHFWAYREMRIGKSVVRMLLWSTEQSRALDSRSLASESLGNDASERQWVYLAERNLRKKTAEWRKQQRAHLQNTWMQCILVSNLLYSSQWSFCFILLSTGRTGMHCCEYHISLCFSISLLVGWVVWKERLLRIHLLDAVEHFSFPLALCVQCWPFSFILGFHIYLIFT